MKEQPVCDALASHMGPDTTVLLIADPEGRQLVLAFPAPLAAEVIAAYHRAGYQVVMATELRKAS